MSKSLLAAKIAGGAVLGTGAVAAGGYGIVEHFRSKEESTTQENTPSLSPNQTSVRSSDSHTPPARAEEGNLASNPDRQPQQLPSTDQTQDASSPRVEGSSSEKLSTPSAPTGESVNSEPSQSRETPKQQTDNSESGTEG